MSPDRFAILPALLNILAGDLATLPDFADLPPVCEIELSWDKDADRLKIEAQLMPTGDDYTQITAINTWAAALGGHTLLGDEARSSHSYLWRRLTAITALPGGPLFEVWTHLTYPIPATN